MRGEVDLNGDVTLRMREYMTCDEPVFNQLLHKEGKGNWRVSNDTIIASSLSTRILDKESKKWDDFIDEGIGENDSRSIFRNATDNSIEMEQECVFLRIFQDQVGL